LSRWRVLQRFNPLSLDPFNFLATQARGAFGPFLNVFLVTQQHWSQSSVGLATMIGGLRLRQNTH
jgi:hypothetical protein